MTSLNTCSDLAIGKVQDLKSLQSSCNAIQRFIYFCSLFSITSEFILKVLGCRFNLSSLDIFIDIGRQFPDSNNLMSMGSLQKHQSPSEVTAVGKPCEITTDFPLISGVCSTHLHRPNTFKEEVASRDDCKHFLRAPVIKYYICILQLTVRQKGVGFSVMKF